MPDRLFTDDEARAAAIMQTVFPVVRRLRHEAHLEWNRPIRVVLPSYFAPERPYDPNNPDHVVGLPILYEGRYVSVIGADGKVYQEAV